MCNNSKLLKRQLYPIQQFEIYLQHNSSHLNQHAQNGQYHQLSYSEPNLKQNIPINKNVKVVRQKTSTIKKFVILPVLAILVGGISYYYK
jgi:hypothetical protein